MKILNIYKNKNENILDTNKEICNGRSCHKLASEMIEESVGKFGQMRLYLCTDCIKNFQK